MWKRGDMVIWFPDRGFGFIKERGAAERGDVFVHEAQVTRGTPHTGAAVIFEAAILGKRNRLCATKCEILE